MRTFFILLITCFLNLFFAACNNNNARHANDKNSSAKIAGSQQQDSIKKGEVSFEQPDTTKTYPYMWEWTAGQQLPTRIIPINILKIKHQQINSYFYETPLTTQIFNGYIFEEEGEKKMQQITLNIFPILKTKDGVVYDLVLDKKKEINISEENVYKLNLGFFYIQKDKIIKFEPTKENYQSLKNGIVSKYGLTVAQNVMTKPIKGKEFEEYIELKGDLCTFHLYDESWHESYVWKRNVGLIKYIAESESDPSLSLALPPNQPE